MSDRRLTHITEVPLRLGDERTEVPARVIYSYSTPMATTEIDPADGGVAIEEIQVQIGNVLATISDYELEPWFPDLVAELEQRCR